MSNSKKHSILFRAVRKVWRIFFPPLTDDEKNRRARQKDYEYLVAHGVETKPGNVTLIGIPIIQKHPDARIIIESDVMLISDSTNANPAGVNHPVILAATKPGSTIIIRKGAGLSGTSVVADNRIDIGEYAMLGVNTNVWDNDFHPIEAQKRLTENIGLNAPVSIGARCFIGANTTILKGVTIGEETVVGTMSLVTKELPAHVIAAGVPAKVLRKLD